MNKINIIKKIHIIFIIFIILQMLMLNINMNVYASGESGTSTGTSESSEGILANILSKGKEWDAMGENAVNSTGLDTSSIWSPMLEIVQALTYIGFAVVIIKGFLLLPSLKGENPEQISKSKEKLITYVIIAVLLAGATRLWAWLLTLLEQISEIS
jgi:hypothetical protein